MRHSIQFLRLLTILPLALCWPARGALALDAANPANRVAPSSEGFQEFLQSLWPVAEQQGITRGTFDAAFAGLTPDPAAPAASNSQAEFDKPLKSYFNEAVSRRRIARGRECLNRWQDELEEIEGSFGVPTKNVLDDFAIRTQLPQATTLQHV